MINTLLIVCALAFSAESGDARHEAAEDKTRTVPGAASLGVKACHDDIERWCKNVKPGEGRLGACLLARKAQLSKRCRRWARHGGVAHEDSSYKEIDKAIVQPGPPASN
jgi:hypothetical protein